MHGDRVLVEIGNIRPDGRAEGRIVRLIGRAHATVVGKFHYGSRRNYVTPIDQKITQEIVIPAGMEIPSEPSVAVPPWQAVTPAEPRKRAAKSPHACWAQEARAAPELGRPGKCRGRCRDHRLAHGHAESSRARGGNSRLRRRFRRGRGNHDPQVSPAASFSARGAGRGAGGRAGHSRRRSRKRRDFRAFPIVTIDGETARDFDDAVIVRRLENGNFELQVHIADVAHYVTPDSALDQEARLRGTSVYFPDRAVPMLPLELSTDICSLRPQVDRLVMSCVMEIDHQGEIVGYELSEGIIRSAERMTYTDVNLVLEGDAGARERYAELVAGFELMRDLALILNRKRERRGSIDFDLPEPVIEFDEFGLMKSITRSERNIAHRLIEEFMLSANECVASYLENRRIASLYRIHEKPDAKRVYDFEVIAATFGYSLGVGPLPIQRVQLKTDRRASYGTGKRTREIEIPKEVHITPRMYQKLTEKIAGKPEERILSFLMLRSLKQARYSEENLGHFALAATCLHPFHLADPPLSRSDRAPHSEGSVARATVAPASRRPESGRNVRRQSDSAGTEEEGPRAMHYGKSSSPEYKRASSPPSGRQDAGATSSPWSKRRDHAAHREAVQPEGGPIPLEELHDIAEESSQSERRADEAERELMEWKKVKFMQDRVGEDFDGLIISVTKYGFFVELTDLFVEGLVPLDSLTDDRYTYHENTREIIGQRNRKIYSMGQRVRVLVDRIDPVEKKIQFAVLEEKPAPKRKNR